MKFLSEIDSAGKVKIVDVAENFTSNNVEGALAEVMGDLNTHEADGAQHSKTARFVVGTSTAGWTLEDCDYLCDGTNDQTEIIQALDDLPATGGEVVILDGTYDITDSINIPKDNVSLRGNGTILKRMYDSTSAHSGSTARGLITLNAKSGCKIQGLQIDGNNATYTSGYNTGIYLLSSSNNTITGNICNNNLEGIYLRESSNGNTITGNTYNNNNYGVYLYLSSNNTITGNTCNYNMEGIYLLSSSDNTITGNICNNNSRGIYLVSSNTDNTITGNTCNYNGVGIRLYSSSNDNTVTGNTYNNNSEGIRLSSSSNNTITGNTCIRGAGTPEDYTTAQHTIYLYSTNNTYNLISSNNCMGKAVTNGGGTGNTLINNKFDASDDIQNIEEQINTKMPISGGALENYTEKFDLLSGTSVSLDLSTNSVFYHSLTGNTTYTITGVEISPYHANSFTLAILQGTTVRTVTFPASVKWQGGEIPDLSTASKTYILTFVTFNGGTTWFGMFGGEFDVS